MDRDEDSLRLAVEHHRAGRLGEAEKLYEQVLERDPRHAEALHLLGLLHSERGSHERALELGRRSIVEKPDRAAFHRSLGETLRRAGRLDEAIASYDAALARAPGEPRYFHERAILLEETGRLEDAVAGYRSALEVEPENAATWADLAGALRRLARDDEAEPAIENALARNPDQPDLHYNLGNLRRAASRVRPAIASYLRALELDPDLVPALVNLALALAETGDPVTGEISLRRAVELEPDDASHLANLGALLIRQDRLVEALASLERSVALDPRATDAWINLGQAQSLSGRIRQALESFDTALSLDPASSTAHAGRASTLQFAGRPEEAAASARRAVALDPASTVAGQNLVMIEPYRQEATLASVAAVHRMWDESHAARFAAGWRPHTRPRDPDRPLSLGFVSGDFRRHPVGYFTLAVIEQLALRGTRILCYYNGGHRDDFTRRYQECSEGFRPIGTLTDDEAAERIRSDGIDLLFDLSGHSGGNRILIFARRPAPVQVTWAAYMATTGLSAMDWIVADRFHIPPGAEEHYRERVHRMPDSYICYGPDPRSGPVAELPALTAGHVTFGSFNSPGKMHPGVIALWSRVLLAVPDARLVLRFRGMTDPAIADTLRSGFAAEGIDLARLRLEEGSSTEGMLAAYQEVDIGLDPLPFSGGVTTCEALWMGVPVITIPGRLFSGRHSLSHVSNAGFPGLIARDEDDYVRLACDLAGDRPRLARMRAGMRDTMRSSPLCDPERFARSFADFCRMAWREWALTAP